jgi:hypothetical protein
MTTDHETSDAVAFAGEWYSQTSREQIGQPIVPLLRRKFGLTVNEAVEAVRIASALRGQRAA